MKNLLSEFKDYVNRGNLVELAIAFVLAAVVGLVVNSIVVSIVLPIIAAIFGQPSFYALNIMLGDTPIFYGVAITAIVDFVVIAFVCFMFVKAYNKMRPPVDEASGPSEVEFLTEIRDALRSR